MNAGNNEIFLTTPTLVPGASVDIFGMLLGYGPDLTRVGRLDTSTQNCGAPVYDAAEDEDVTFCTISTVAGVQGVIAGGKPEPSPVPAPPAMALALSGIGALALHRRRQPHRT